MLPFLIKKLLINISCCPLLVCSPIAGCILGCLDPVDDSIHSGPTSPAYNAARTLPIISVPAVPIHSWDFRHEFATDADGVYRYGYCPNLTTRRYVSVNSCFIFTYGNFHLGTKI